MITIFPKNKRWRFTEALLKLYDQKDSGQVSTETYSSLRRMTTVCRVKKLPPVFEGENA